MAKTYHFSGPAHPDDQPNPLIAELYDATNVRSEDERPMVEISFRPVASLRKAIIDGRIPMESSDINEWNMRDVVGWLFRQMTHIANESGAAFHINHPFPETLEADDIAGLEYSLVLWVSDAKAVHDILHKHHMISAKEQAWLNGHDAQVTESASEAGKVIDLSQFRE